MLSSSLIDWGGREREREKGRERGYVRVSAMKWGISCPSSAGRNRLWTVLECEAIYNSIFKTDVDVVTLIFTVLELLKLCLVLHFVYKYCKYYCCYLPCVVA